LIEPRSDGVSTATRGLLCSAVSRVSATGAAGGTGTVPAAGGEGPPAWLGEGWPGTGGCACWAIGAWPLRACCNPCGMPKK
jgi:hypothetical protein